MPHREFICREGAWPGHCDPLGGQEGEGALPAHVLPLCNLLQPGPPRRAQRQAGSATCPDTWAARPGIPFRGMATLSRDQPPGPAEQLLVRLPAQLSGAQTGTTAAPHTDAGQCPQTPALWGPGLQEGQAPGGSSVPSEPPRGGYLTSLKQRTRDPHVRKEVKGHPSILPCALQWPEHSMTLSRRGCPHPPLEYT